jgi:hypothetical protein
MVGTYSTTAYTKFIHIYDVTSAHVRVVRWRVSVTCLSVSVCVYICESFDLNFRHTCMYSAIRD